MPSADEFTDLDLAMADQEADEDSLICASCGHTLDGDPDEDPTGNAGRPQCGECARSANFVTMDYADGELDGRIG